MRTAPDIRDHLKAFLDRERSARFARLHRDLWPQHAPLLDEARSLLSRFQAMIRERRRLDLDLWIEAAARSLLSSFARGLLKG